MYQNNVGKEIRLNIRIKEDLKKDLAIVAQKHGLTVSSFVNYLLTKIVNDEKKENPFWFKVNKFELNQTETSEITKLIEEKINKNVIIK